MQCGAVCRSVLQCVAVRCSALQCVVVCHSVLQCVAVCCRVLQSVTVCCSVLQSVAVCCRVLQCVAVCCSVKCTHTQVYMYVCTGWSQRLYMGCRTGSNIKYELQCVAVRCRVSCVAVCCNVLQHTATYCNTYAPGITGRSPRVSARKIICGV